MGFGGVLVLNATTNLKVISPRLEEGGIDVVLEPEILPFAVRLQYVPLTVQDRYRERQTIEDALVKLG